MARLVRVDTATPCGGSVPALRFISPSSIDADRLAGHESGLIRGEKRYHRRNLVGAAETADRDCFSALGKPDFEIVAVFAPVRADRPRRADRSGTDCVDC